MTEKKYIITIEEHISGELTVYANDMGEAMEIAEEKYKNGEFVVEPTPPTSRLMMAREENTNQETEWVEF